MNEMFELDQMEQMEALQEQLTEAAEALAERSEGSDTVGYSSDYRKWEMERAAANGNQLAYEYAKNNYAKALIRERYGADELQTMVEKMAAPLDAREADRIGAADEGSDTLGYSSDYYKWEIERAIANGNRIAEQNARNNYAKALVRESVGADETDELNSSIFNKVIDLCGDTLAEHGERYVNAETAEEQEEILQQLERAIWRIAEDTFGADEAPEALGYSADHYKWEMERAIANGNQIAYNNAKDNYAKALVRESVGASDAFGITDVEYYSSQAANALKNGNKIAYENAMERVEKAQAKEDAKKLGAADEAPEALGYSAETYQHRMADALRRGDKSAYQDALQDFNKYSHTRNGHQDMLDGMTRQEVIRRAEQEARHPNTFTRLGAAEETNEYPLTAEQYQRHMVDAIAEGDNAAYQEALKGYVAASNRVLYARQALDEAAAKATIEVPVGTSDLEEFSLREQERAMATEALEAIARSNQRNS